MKFDIISLFFVLMPDEFIDECTKLVGTNLFTEVSDMVILATTLIDTAGVVGILDSILGYFGRWFICVKDHAFF